MSETINTEPWVDYQPARARDKYFHNIRLRNGEVVKCCWPSKLLHLSQWAGAARREW